ncbi:Uncharacterized protein OBRU01_24219 [Operophtera brumata]|uniref:Uncharacterized protein n=1 Tax=Operophtera brumata TaxID=104452 RepID=A0A0L7KPI8_OPEBR|nr:Uncharacterized protein OBRU01_24219 [Operophtera brumata]
MTGANKDWKTWRKAYQDMKTLAKKKFSMARRAANSTGGGPPPSNVDTMDLSTDVLSGNGEESKVVFLDK